MPFGQAMNLSFQPIRACDVHEMTRWTYAPPYDVYNLSHPPDASDIEYWLDPKKRVHAICEESVGLIGYCSFGVDRQVPGGDYRADALDIGMAIRPDRTGHGGGVAFAQGVIDVARTTYAPPTGRALLRVTIARFNQRAQRVWQRCGFEAVDSFTATHNDRVFDILIGR